MKPEANRKATVTSVGERESRIEREFDAPRDRVWRAMTDPALIAQWWGRGNKVVVEKYELEKGGHWRFVEHSGQGVHGFEGRFSEIEPPARIVQTFEWDGMPGHVALETMTLEEIPGGRTRLVTHTLFMTRQDRDGMFQSGMEAGVNESYAALDRVLQRLG